MLTCAGSLFKFTCYLIINLVTVYQTHRSYLFRRLTTTRWFSWEPTGRRASPARWRHPRLKWLCTASFPRGRWQWTGRRSPLTSRRASPFIGRGLITLEPCSVSPVWATWGRAPPSTCSSMSTVSAAAKSIICEFPVCLLLIRDHGCINRNWIQSVSRASVHSYESCSIAHEVKNDRQNTHDA